MRRVRRRVLPTALAVAGVVTIGGCALATLPSSATDDPPSPIEDRERPPTAVTDQRRAAPPAAPGTTPPVGSTDEPRRPTPAEPTTPPLARAGELELWLPAAEPLVVAFHEASHVSAGPLDPIGVLADDRNTTRTDLPADDDAGGPYLVLSSRGRAAGPTSAVDVVLLEGTAVLSPVTGTVSDVREYLLYGRHRDVRVEIVPEARPDLRVVIIHVDGVTVDAGDRVDAGVSPLAATARLLPFASHVDRETEPERHPHVHLEVGPVDRPRPGDEVDDPDGDQE